MIIMKLLCVIVTSVAAFKPNLCIECKHFKKDFFSQPKYGKCTLFPIVLEDDNYEVTGIVATEKLDHQFCLIVRKHGKCGLEGKLFEPKV
jgi:hypothetical protein